MPSITVSSRSCNKGQGAAPSMHVCVYRKWWRLKGNAALFCGAKGTMADRGDTTMAGITSGLIELSRGGFRCVEEPGSQSLPPSLPLSILSFLCRIIHQFFPSSIPHPLSGPPLQIVPFVSLTSSSFLCIHGSFSLMDVSRSLF